MNDRGFYRSFENEFRGSRDLIKSRLEVYLPFVRPLLDLAGSGNRKMLDLGCGRGEWLELMKREGAEARGVDIDAGMLKGCDELGLNVGINDALKALVETGSESLLVVSSFHVVEHLEFAKLHELVNHAHRVLVPGGLLILETPNPENPVVASVGFNLDPTHRKPLPPPLLAFLVNYCGFGRCRDIRLQQVREFSADGPVGLFEVFSSASQDYAIVAQKAGPEEFLTALDQAFGGSYGISLQDLADLYDASLARQFSQQDKRVEDNSSHIAELNRRFNEISQNLQQLEERHASDMSSLEHSLSASIEHRFREFKELVARQSEQMEVSLAGQLQDVLAMSARQSEDLHALEQRQTAKIEQLRQSLVQQKHRHDAVQAATTGQLNSIRQGLSALEDDLQRIGTAFTDSLNSPLRRLFRRLSGKQPPSPN